MGVKVKFIAVAGIAVIVIALVFYFINIAIFCENNDQLDFKFFKIDCNTVPNKKVQLDTALEQGCQALRTDYECSFRSVHSIMINYEEWGKPARNYTLFELCGLKSNYYTEQVCARFCGCNI
jgi:hypothetical protein